MRRVDKMFGTDERMHVLVQTMFIMFLKPE